MTYECFEVTNVGKIAHVQMSRGENLNTMVPSFWKELPEIINAISDEGRARAIVISSTGRHFCAGMDLAVFTGGNLSGKPSEGDERKHTEQCASSTGKLQPSERARMPVLVAIHAGGGAVIWYAADMRYATADEPIQEINIGMTADVGTLQRLPKLVPEGVVRELAYTGRRMSAQRAYEVGLVNQIFETHEELVEGVLDIANEIATKSPLAIWGTKESVNYARDHSVADSLNFIATWQAGMFQPKDMAAAFEAQASSEDPDFDDLPPMRKGLGS